MAVEAHDPKLFINRELSALAFNARVLEEAADRSLPLYERLRFLGIVASNLDEFFMVRVAGLKRQQQGDIAELTPDGASPTEQLDAISRRAHELVSEQSRVWVQELLPALTEAGIQVLRRHQLADEQKKAARAHFTNLVFPALTPLAIDSGHPFPHLRNKSLNIAVRLRRQGQRRKRPDGSEGSFAVVQMPSVLPRLVALPTQGRAAYLLLEELIAAHVEELFAGFTVEQTATFRLTRNWDISIDEEDADDLLSAIQDELKRRDRGSSVRLEIDGSCSPAIEATLMTAVGLGSPDVYRLESPLQVSDLAALADLDPRPELKYEPFVPAQNIGARREDDRMIDLIAQRDILLHHPYEAFDPVAHFIQEAADDPNVLAIKQTLYRISPEGRIARALSRAAENGKQVAVLVEIKARLDEANNIQWARRMEEAGVHVVYGVVGLKTHSKVAMVVRKEAGGIRRYVHLGTGNYNHQTASRYTDVSLFTARSEIADDVSALFNVLTGYATAPQWRRLVVAPFNLHQRVIELIRREADRAREGKPARIIAKINSLADPSVIRALYAASEAGVEIDLLVRGICCLRPGITGKSDRIRVTSIVDRFLEHSRILTFGVGETLEVYLSSADWMPRNFFRRVEVMWPVEDKALRERIVDEILGTMLRDNVKARRLLPDGAYVHAPTGEVAVRAQAELLRAAHTRSSLVVEPGLRAPRVRPPDEEAAGKRAG